jgi:hypothetical protein
VVPPAEPGPTLLRRRFGIVFLVRVLSKRAVAAKVPADAADRACEHLADFAGPQVAEAAEHEFVALPVPGAVEEDGVDVWVEAQVGRRALQDSDGARLRASVPIPTPARHGVEQPEARSAGDFASRRRFFPCVSSRN